jgi:hypothetical protein
MNSPQFPASEDAMSLFLAVSQGIHDNPEALTYDDYFDLDDCGLADIVKPIDALDFRQSIAEPISQDYLVALNPQATTLRITQSGIRALRKARIEAGVDRYGERN